MKLNTNFIYNTHLYIEVVKQFILTDKKNNLPSTKLIIKITGMHHNG